MNVRMCVYSLRQLYAIIQITIVMATPPIVFLDVNGVLQPFSKDLCGGKVTEDHEFSAVAMEQVRRSILVITMQGECSCYAQADPHPLMTTVGSDREGDGCGACSEQVIIMLVWMVGCMGQGRQPGS